VTAAADSANEHPGRSTPRQVGPLPETAHDFRVDAIVRPEAIITCAVGRRPDGLLWDHLSDAKIAAIPVLADRRRSSHSHDEV